MLSGRGLCDELITRPEESYRLCCVVVCVLETSRMGAPYIYDISRLRVKALSCYFGERERYSLKNRRGRANWRLLQVCTANMPIRKEVRKVSNG